MTTRRIMAVAIGVSALIGVLAVPAGADPSGTTDGQRFVERPPAELIPAGTAAGTPASMPVSRSGSTAVSGRCDQPVLADARRDARSFDIVSTTVTSDCAVWTFTTRFARPIDIERFGGLFIALNINSRGDGCDRAEWSILTAPGPRGLEAHVLDTSDCDPDLWVTHGRPDVDQPDERTLQVTFGMPSDVLPGANWTSTVFPRQGQSFDVAPNRGVSGSCTRSPDR